MIVAVKRNLSDCVNKSCVNVREVKTESIKELSGYFGMKF